jgi:hypothetical protein
MSEPTNSSLFSSRNGSAEQLIKGNVSFHFQARNETNETV